MKQFGNGYMQTQIARFMGPIWGPPLSCRPQMGPMLVPRILLSGYAYTEQMLSNNNGDQLHFIKYMSCDLFMFYFHINQFTGRDLLFPAKLRFSLATLLNDMIDLRSSLYVSTAHLSQLCTISLMFFSIKIQIPCTYHSALMHIVTN